MSQLVRLLVLTYTVYTSIDVHALSHSVESKIATLRVKKTRLHFVQYTTEDLPRQWCRKPMEHISYNRALATPVTTVIGLLTAYLPTRMSHE